LVECWGSAFGGSGCSDGQRGKRWIEMTVWQVFYACALGETGAPKPAGAGSVAGPGVVLAEGGKSAFKIVLSEQASPSERHAAEELQGFLKEMSGAELPIVTDAAPRSGPEIVLGNSRRLRALKLSLDWDTLGDEGFVIRTVGEDLVIAGGRLRGTMYGVHTLLEDHLGCRWFAPGVSHIPRRDRVALGPIDDEQVPVLEYREPFFTCAFDGEWSARNRMNSSAARLEVNHGGKVTYSHFVHTFRALVPPEKYFDDHPEYFSLVKGERLREHEQLCLSNPEVLRLVIEGVRRWIEKAPEANIYSVSQNDWAGYCECEKCAALDEAEGTHAASVIHLVNQVAEAIEKDCPGKAIDTLAYQYSRKPPKTLRPRPNVIVRLCTIECCFSHPLDKCSHEQNRAFVKDIVGWSQLTKRLYVWDYVTDFAHYVMPFPNLRVLGPNVRFFVDHGVKGIFEEGSYGPGGGGEMSELRSYVLAKVLWNPEYEQQRAITEFLCGFFKGAAEPIREYLELLHKQVEPEDVHAHIFDSPRAPYFSDSLVRRARELFEEALLLADDEEVLKRVQVARLPVIYLQMAREPHLRPTLLPGFMAVAKEAGIAQISEGRPLEETEKSLERR
jgi:hypothetical protein